MIGFGNIQPSLVRKNDGKLVAFMRDNGPHHRIRLSRSRDDGVSWSPVVDSPFPNPGAGIEAIRLADGHWALVYNDLPRGRHSLAVSLSDDEGASWKWTRHLERGRAGQGPVSLSVDVAGDRRLDPRDVHRQRAGPGQHDRARAVQRGLAQGGRHRSEGATWLTNRCDRRLGSHPYYPWIVVGLLWFCGFFNYADRQAVYSRVSRCSRANSSSAETQIGYPGLGVHVRLCADIAVYRVTRSICCRAGC